MKKMVIVLVCMAGLTVSASAAEWFPGFHMSGGVGGTFAYSWSSYFEKYSVDYTLENGTRPRIREDHNGSYAESMLYNGYAFLDFTWAELDLGFGGYRISPKNGMKDVFGVGGGAISGTYLDIGVLAKYPIGITRSFSFFPLIGANAQIPVTSNEDIPYYDIWDLYSALWIRMGFGFDIRVTSRVYIRAEALYGIRTVTMMEGDVWNVLSGRLDEQYPSKHFHDWADVNYDVVTHGPQAKFAVGFRF
jgi:hypothetical protein